MTNRPPCKEPGCDRPKMQGRHRCGWHHLLTLSMDRQVEFAQGRLALKQSKPGFKHRARVPASEWPAGARWCAGCQCFVPLFYTSGSRCKACASRAAHASRIQRVYDLSPEDYESLLRWQGGRCYICGQQPHGRRLAVDHDHGNGEVRGLLCANDEWGCNMSLRRLLDDVEMARRAVAYVERSPLQRMRAGEPGADRPLSVVEQARVSTLGLNGLGPERRRVVNGGAQLAQGNGLATAVPVPPF